MDLLNPPERYWHCYVQLKDQKAYAVVNDLTYEELTRNIVIPWHSGKAFTVSGRVVRSSSDVDQIRVAHTSRPQQTFAEEHNARMRANRRADFATNRQLLPFRNGEDVTQELLFANASRVAAGEEDLIESVCRRLPRSAQILATGRRKGKTPFLIEDEYDVQDLLHATLRAFLKYSVQEDPLGKVAGAKSSRADISIQELGTLIEVKYVHTPDDQKRLFSEYSEDLVLYAQWPYLKTLIYLIYNSGDLRDAEAFEKLSGDQEVNGKRFRVKVVLA